MKKRSRTLAVSLLLFLLFFGALLSYWNLPLFTTDEGDIFAVGYQIARGRQLYVDILSQHMPVMYYISALFTLLGASTTCACRLCFYALMSLLWLLICRVYADVLPRRSLILYPLLYVLLMGRIGHAHAILSDHFQGISMAILALELIRFDRDRTMPLKHCCLISLAVFLSFGSAFVSVFAIFFVVLTFFVMEMLRLGRKEGLRAVGSFFRLYWKLFAVVLLPLALLFGALALNGSLSGLYRWAYRLNRDVYPKYISSYGSSVGGSMIAGFYPVMRSLDFTNLSEMNASAWLGVLGFIAGLVYLYRSGRGPVLLGGLVLLLFGSATRGFYSFHGLPALAVMCLLDAYALDMAIRDFPKSVPRTAVVIALVLGLLVPHIHFYHNILALPRMAEFTEEEKAEGYTSAVDLLTEHNELFASSAMVGIVLYETDALCISTCTVPWFWEEGHEEVMQTLRASPPRVYLFDPDMTVWGYRFDEYAAELVAFVKENYTCLEALGYPLLYVRNDYAQEAARLIENSPLTPPTIEINSSI